MKGEKKEVGECLIPAVFQYRRTKVKNADPFLISGAMAHLCIDYKEWKPKACAFESPTGTQLSRLGVFRIVQTAAKKTRIR